MLTTSTTTWWILVVLLCHAILARKHPLPETADSWFLDQESINEKEERKHEETRSVLFPRGCLSNQQCLMDSLARGRSTRGEEPMALPFCWPDGMCRGERSLVLTISSAPKSNASIGEAMGKPFPVFHDGETMCVTAMFNPSVVLLDELWTEEEELREEEEQQRRLLAFQSFPLRVDLEDMWMCSSKRNYQKPTDDTSRRASTTETSIAQLVNTAMSVASYASPMDERDRDVVPHTFIRQ